MAGDDRDIHHRLETIARGIQALDATPDAGVRAHVHALVQSIVELQGSAFERMLAIVHASPGGAALIDEIARDPLIGSLLVLHSLHPQTVEERVWGALERLRPALAAAHAEVQLVELTESRLRLRVIGGREPAALVEGAVRDAAPDVAAIDIEVAEAAGFVPLQALRTA